MWVKYQLTDDLFLKCPNAWLLIGKTFDSFSFCIKPHLILYNYSCETRIFWKGLKIELNDIEEFPYLISEWTSFLIFIIFMYISLNTWEFVSIFLVVADINSVFLNMTNFLMWFSIYRVKSLFLLTFLTTTNRMLVAVNKSGSPDGL